MLVLEPTLAILDETDSGLDIDALKIVAAGVNAYRSVPDQIKSVQTPASQLPPRAIILVTHYQRLLNYIQPDFVHVMFDGSIVQSAGPALALELEDRGYEGFSPAMSAT